MPTKLNAKNGTKKREASRTRIHEFSPIHTDKNEWDKLEKKILEHFRRELYFPILKYLQINNIVKNSKDDLLRALQSGKVYFYRGHFYGKYTASISKGLQEVGAVWNKSSSTWKLLERKLPADLRIAISFSKVKFGENIAKIDDYLRRFPVIDFIRKIDSAPNFFDVIQKAEKSLKKSLEKITVVPQLTENQVQKIAENWNNNMKLWIKNFTEEEIKNLREKVSSNVYAGNRYENLIQLIQNSYNVTYNKAKFLARQETNLLMSNYNYTRYQDAGVEYFRWQCVNMPKQPSPGADYKRGEVRYYHGIHDGKVFRFDSPPITDAKGGRKLPMQDYNCRCIAVPMLNQPD